MCRDGNILVAAAGFLTLDLCLKLNVFGLLSDSRTAQMYTPIGGWSLTPEQIYIGLTRLFYIGGVPFIESEPEIFFNHILEMVWCQIGYPY